MNINEQFPSKYLKASDLNGGKVLVTIKDCIVETLGEDRRPVLYFSGKEKGVVLNKTNATNISDAYGPDTEDWTGRKVVLYVADVDFQGRSMEAIRIRKPRDNELNGGSEAAKEATVPPRFEGAAIGDDDVPFRANFD